MRGFRFRLQKVLDLRRAKAKEAMLQVALAMRTLDGEERALHDLVSARNAAWRELHDAVGSSSDASGVDLDLRRIQAIDGEIGRCEERIRLAREALNEVREVAKECRVEEAALDRLREKAFDEHELEVKRLERLEMDEIAVTRHARARIPGVER